MRKPDSSRRRGRKDGPPTPTRPLKSTDALAAIPIRTPVLRTEERENGGLLLTVHVQPPRWHRWLGVDAPLERSFGLDAFGREVYEMCDGRRSVRELIREFAIRHRLDATEAEIAVTRFLRMLMRKGLIAAAVPTSDSGADESEV